MRKRGRSERRGGSEGREEGTEGEREEFSVFFHKLINIITYT